MRSRPVSDNDGPSPVKEVGGNRSRRVLCRVFHLNVEAFGRLLYLERRKEGKEGKEGGEGGGERRKGKYRRKRNGDGDGETESIRISISSQHS
jgi:hypothetical protein